MTIRSVSSRAISVESTRFEACWEAPVGRAAPHHREDTRRRVPCPCSRRANRIRDSGCLSNRRKEKTSRQNTGLRRWEQKQSSIICCSGKTTVGLSGTKQELGLSHYEGRGWRGF